MLARNDQLLDYESSGAVCHAVIGHYAPARQLEFVDGGPTAGVTGEEFQNGHFEYAQRVQVLLLLFRVLPWQLPHAQKLLYDLHARAYFAMIVEN